MDARLGSDLNFWVKRGTVIRFLGIRPIEHIAERIKAEVDSHRVVLCNSSVFGFLRLLVCWVFVVVRFFVLKVHSRELQKLQSERAVSFHVFEAELL